MSYSVKSSDVSKDSSRFIVLSYFIRRKVPLMLCVELVSGGILASHSLQVRSFLGCSLGRMLKELYLSQTPPTKLHSLDAASASPPHT